MIPLQLADRDIPNPSYYGIAGDATAWDVGAYGLTWLKMFRACSKGRVELFEAHPYFARRIEKILDGSWSNQVLHRYGLSNRSGMALISDAGDGSSIGESGIECELMAAHEAADLFGMPDVMKLNIEGSEYDVLDDLAAHDLLPKTQLYLIQFHRSVPDYQKRYDVCAAALSKSHHQVALAPFVWEAWLRA